MRPATGQSPDARWTGDDSQRDHRKVRETGTGLKHGQPERFGSFRSRGKAQRKGHWNSWGEDRSDRHCLWRMPRAMPTSKMNSNCRRFRTRGPQGGRMSAPSQAATNNLEAFWMPFTANRQFKQAPRMFVVRKGHALHHIRRPPGAGRNSWPLVLQRRPFPSQDRRSGAKPGRRRWTTLRPSRWGTRRPLNSPPVLPP